MIGLFDNDPAFKKRIRDSKGRFATAERALYDKAKSENVWLRFQVEKYRRIAESSSGAFIAQQRIISNLTRKIADLKKELALIKKSKR